MRRAGTGACRTGHDASRSCFRHDQLLAVSQFGGEVYLVEIGGGVAPPAFARASATREPGSIS